MKLNYKGIWIKFLFLCMSLVVLALQGCGGGGGSNGPGLPSTGVSGNVSDAVTGSPIGGVSIGSRNCSATIARYHQ
jgi:hypothetical protein